MTEVAHARVLEMLEYDPTTGVFRWRRKPNRNVVAGSVAGSVDAYGYLQTRLDKKPLKLHRLAWFYVHGEWPAGQIDHANGIRDDNRLENLRVATGSQNRCNRRAGRPNKSGFHGVFFHRKTGKWQARVTLQRKHYSFGYHSTPEAASAVYEAGARELKGEFYPGPRLTAAA
jgi:hypothetical protein